MIFLFKFGLIYLISSLAYGRYLEPYTTSQPPKTDPITVHVAELSSGAMHLMGFETYIEQNDDEPSMNYILEGRWVSRIVEGCNGVSVMLLFVTFILAFGGSGWISTSLFIVGGLMLTHVINVLRIAALNWVFRYAPEYAEVSHDIIFPLVIYGTIFVLWVIWVNFFAVFASTGHTSTEKVHVKEELFKH